MYAKASDGRMTVEFDVSYKERKYKKKEGEGSINKIQKWPI
jgi:hypothetical protein